MSLDRAPDAAAGITSDVVDLASARRVLKLLILTVQLLAKTRTYGEIVMSLNRIKTRWNNIPIWACYCVVFVVGMIFGALA